MFEELENELKQIVTLDQNKILREIYRLFPVEQFIVQLNTEGQKTSQLYNFGIDANGDKIEPPYSFATIQLKLDGDGDKRVDHVTLKDSGEFYESFQIKVLKDGFEIQANPIKDDDDLTQKYGEEIIGLTEENKEVLSEYLLPFIQEEITKRILD